MKAINEKTNIFELTMFEVKPDTSPSTPTTKNTKPIVAMKNQTSRMRAVLFECITPTAEENMERQRNVFPAGCTCWATFHLQQQNVRSPRSK